MNPKHLKKFRKRSLQRASCNYADIYFCDDICEHNEEKEEVSEGPDSSGPSDSSYVSPSDLLLGFVDLKPPFTAKTSQAKAHEGILAIGEGIHLEKHRKFSERFNEQIESSNEAWKLVLQYHKPSIQSKVTDIYRNILKKKHEVMMSEFFKYYEKSLKELEHRFKDEKQVTLQSIVVSSINYFNTEITRKLKDERKKLEDFLYKNLIAELKKIEHYYAILLRNEKHRNKILIDNAIRERNFAVQMLIKTYEAEKYSTTMYILCMEKKKCKAKRLNLENYFSKEENEYLSKIKLQDELLTAYKLRDNLNTDYNQDWESKTKKILELFTKFICFSLKLLPEQTAFLLEFQNLLLTQMNEIQKNPNNKRSILVDEEKLNTIIPFEKETSSSHSHCKEPFIIEGCLQAPTPPRVDSTKTLASDESLDYFRVQRHLIYAKCEKFEFVQKLLDDARCRCRDAVTRDVSSTELEIMESTSKGSPSRGIDPLLPCSSANFETDSYKNQNTEGVELPAPDFKRLNYCPITKCQHRHEFLAFPQINDYFEYDEEKYERVKAILDNVTDTSEGSAKYIDVGELLRREPFPESSQTHFDMGTQYQSHLLDSALCPCAGNTNIQRAQFTEKEEQALTKEIMETFRWEEENLITILKERQSIFNLFTNEKYNFIRK